MKKRTIFSAHDIADLDYADHPLCHEQRFAQLVIDWQCRHGRHDLPWQQTRDPYRVWVSEIMLQQTQVAAVIAYYQRFLDVFPNVRVLAAASQDAVMAQWSGLGYYSRARNLHRCAQRIVADFDGQFPREPRILAELPGIGRSTAAAIAAFAFGVRAAILDGNVKRVLARVFGVDGYPGEKKVENVMWTLAETLLPEAADAERSDSQIGVYTQGLMDLGATLCTHGRPACLEMPQDCPLHMHCVAAQTERIAELPAPRPRKALPQRATTLLMIWDGTHLLLQRRPDSGVWGGLWSFPERDAVQIKGSADADDLTHLTQMSWANGGQMPVVLNTLELPEIQHVFTHFRLTMQPLLIRIPARPAVLFDRAASNQWMTIEEALALGLPTPIRRLIESMRSQLENG